MVQPQANGSLYSCLNKGLKKYVIHCILKTFCELKTISRIMKIPYLCINNINIK